MKINIILGPFLGLPPENCGAVEKLWLNLAREFAKSGDSVQIVARSRTRRDSTEDHLEIVPMRGFTRSGIRSRDLTADLLYSHSAAASARAADVTVVNAFWLPLLAPLRRKLGRIVYNVQRMPKHQFGLYRGVDLFVPVSTAVRDAMVQQSPRLAPRTIVIGNAVDTRTFAFSSGFQRHRILYAGRIHPEKGLDRLIRAMREVVQRKPDAELRIIGPAGRAEGGGGSDYLQKLRTDAAGLPVEFKEPIYSDDLLARELATAAAFVYPSIADRGDAFPLAVLEAMSCGAISIVSALACFRDYVDNGRSGFVFDHHAPDADAMLADRIVAALSLPDDARSRMRDASRASAIRFSVPSIATQYREAFSRLIQ
jgi:glycosyltransferase involved in cell wall biosynthesis